MAGNPFMDLISGAMNNVMGYLGGGQQQQLPQQQMLMPDANLVANAHPYNTGEVIQQANPYQDMTSDAMKAVFNYLPGLGSARDAVIANRNQDPAGLAKAVGSFATDMLDVGPATAGIILGKGLKGAKGASYAPGSPLWEKLAKESPYDVPLNSYTPLYEGFDEMVEIPAKAALAQDLTGIPKVGKTKELISRFLGKDISKPIPITEYKGKYKELMNDPAFAEAYPPIQEHRVNVTAGPGVAYDADNFFAPMFGEINLADRDYRKIPGHAGHEAYGHAVAAENNWAGGSSPKLAGSQEAYMNDAGELFARINDRRLGYTQEQINAKNFWKDTIEPNPKGPGSYPSMIDYTPERVNKSGSIVRGDIDRSVDPPRIMTPYEYDMKLEAIRKANAERIAEKLKQQHGKLPEYYTPEIAMAEKIKRNKERYLNKKK